MTENRKAIDKAKIDIALEATETSLGVEDYAYESLSDRAGSDDDADYLIHQQAMDPDSLEDLGDPRTRALLEWVTHIPMNCQYCETN